MNPIIIFLHNSTFISKTPPGWSQLGLLITWYWCVWILVKQQSTQAKQEGMNRIKKWLDSIKCILLHQAAIGIIDSLQLGFYGPNASLTWISHMYTL